MELREKERLKSNSEKREIWKGMAEERKRRKGRQTKD